MEEGCHERCSIYSRRCLACDSTINLGMKSLKGNIYVCFRVDRWTLLNWTHLVHGLVQAIHDVVSRMFIILYLRKIKCLNHGLNQQEKHGLNHSSVCLSFLWCGTHFVETSHLFFRFIYFLLNKFHARVFLLKFGELLEFDFKPSFISSSESPKRINILLHF